MLLNHPNHLQEKLDLIIENFLRILQIYYDSRLGIICFGIYREEWYGYRILEKSFVKKLEMLERKDTKGKELEATIYLE
jgi:hypothetical protein